MKLSDVLLDGFKDDGSSLFDVQALIYRYLRYWWIFLIAIVTTISLAIAYIFYATPIYNASTSLLINVDKGIDYTQNAVFNDIANFGASSKVDNEIEILGSYSLMRDAIEDLPLHASFFIEDKYSRRKEIYGTQVPIEVVILNGDPSDTEIPEDKTITVHLSDEFYELKISENHVQKMDYGQSFTNWYGTLAINKTQEFEGHPERTIIISLDNKDQVAGRLSASLNIEQSAKLASIVNISLGTTVPQKGVDVLNKLTEVYNLQAINEKNVIATNTLKFIDEQLEGLTQNLKASEQKIEGYKQQNQISNINTELSSNVENLGAYESQLSRNKIQLEVLQSIEHYLANPSSIDIDVTTTLTIDDNTLSTLVERYNQLQSEKERLLRTVQPGNPLVVNLDEQLNSIRRNISTSLQNIKQSLQIENRNLSSMVTSLASRTQTVPEIERGLLELTREHSIIEEHYLYLVKKREESALSLAATTLSNSRVIDSASASGPVSPNRNMILAFAILMGFAFPIGIIYTKDLVGGKIIDKREVKKITRIPIIGEISHNNSKEPLVISKKRRTPIAEQFRLLRTNLKFLNNNLDDKVILVTSSVSGEGKTFFSLNLGVSLSLTGKKVVVLEFDLRKPALLKSMKIKKNRPGITNYLIGEAEIEETIYSYEEEKNLFVIGCGDIPEDPAELMLHEKVVKMIDLLKERFDYVILDSAPVGTVADALNLVPYSDLSLYVIRYNYTKRDHVKFIEEISLDAKLRRPYIVMNDAKIGSGYYGHAYGYGYENKAKAYS